MALRIRVIAKHPLVASSLVSILSADRELRRLLLPPVAGLDSLPQHGKSQLFVVDAFIPLFDLSTVARLLRVRCPGSKFLALVGPEQGSAEEILRFLHNGIEGIATLSERFQTDLPAAVRALLAGQLWAPPRVLAEYSQHIKLLLSHRLLPSLLLTGRESQILQLMIRRLSNKEIAAALGITERTIRFHVSHIFAKLRVEDRRSLLVTLEKLMTEPS